MDHPRLDQQPGLRHHGDGGAVRAGPVLVHASWASSRCPTSACRRRLDRGALPRRIARGGGARGQQAGRGGAEQHRRRQAHHVARFEGRSQTSVEFTSTPTWAARCRTCATASPRCSRSFPRDAKAPTVARFNNDNSQPIGRDGRCCRKTRSARELSMLGEPDGRQAPAARRRRGARGHQRPGDARGAHRPRPGAAARLRRHAGRDRRRAARGQRRPAGGPAVGRRRRTRCCASRAGCATRSSSPTSSWRAAAACR